MVWGIINNQQCEGGSEVLPVDGANAGRGLVQFVRDAVPCPGKPKSEEKKMGEQTGRQSVKKLVDWQKQDSAENVGAVDGFIT